MLVTTLAIAQEESRELHCSMHMVVVNWAFGSSHSAWMIATAVATVVGKTGYCSSEIFSNPPVITPQGGKGTKPCGLRTYPTRRLPREVLTTLNKGDYTYVWVLPARVLTVLSSRADSYCVADFRPPPQVGLCHRKVSCMVAECQWRTSPTALERERERE